MSNESEPTNENSRRNPLTLKDANPQLEIRPDAHHSNVRMLV